MTRTDEEFRAAAASPKTEANGASQSPPPMTEKRSLRQQPTQRTFFAPDTTPSRTTTSRSTSQTHQSQQNQQQQNQQQYQQPVTNNNRASQAPMIGNAPHFPEFRPGPNTLPVLLPVQTPRTAPNAYQKNNLKRKLPDVNGANAPPGPRLGSGHIGGSLMHRIQMSLRGGLSDDVNFSVASLVRITFEAGDELQAAVWPGLCDILFHKTRESLSYLKDKVHEDLVADTQLADEQEMLNCYLLIIRNIALHPDNAKRFATVNKAKDILLDGFSMTDNTSLTEMRSYLWDMAESMATFFPYSPNDPLLDIFIKGLESPERGTLISSMKALCRFTMGRDEYNCLGEIAMPTILRLTSFLMLEDDELVAAALDLLYQYTTNEENIKKLLEAEGYELVRHLVRLLLWQGITGEQLVYIKVVKKAPPRVYEIPQLPDEIVQDLLTYGEPERATKWMRCCFEEDPDADITQIALWQAYQARFNEFTSRGFPLLPAAEFIKNVSVAFQNASAMVIPSPQGQKFIIKGIRARETPMSVNGRVYLSCKWFNTPGNAVSRCTQQLASPQDLWNHVRTVHLPPDSSSDSRPLWCNWAGCSRFGSEGEHDRLNVLGHVRTHIPDARKRAPVSKEEQEMMDDPEARVIIRRCQTALEPETGHAAGIPMTSVLVLRNIRKRGGHLAKQLIDGMAVDLAEVMSVNKPLAELAGDLIVGGLGGVE
ncbi:hypothetical protein FN846DRAFT_596755 [Sphaerosporella brunnea]|uniref:RFX-type winged-helix domain-containing protein n=1 Tax=Sphaerosporella brunnea TaxID=1250544 RepID=A0A5J5F1F0_9PEZI|nr:hypothetical protein FN846DRAFT_596755 [Sphaerosporella brunnea]